MRGSIVVSEVDHGHGVAPSFKRFPTSAQSQAFVVVGPRNMSKEKMSNRHGESLLQIDGQRLVREVTQTATHPLFQGVGVGPFAKHVHVVIGLHEDRLRSSERFFHRGGEMADVRNMGKP